MQMIMTQGCVVRLRLLAGGLLVLAGGSIASPPARALECPTPQTTASPGVLRESPAKTTEMANLLATGDQANRVSAIITDLRKRYPGVSDAEVENYLVTAYCPAVARLSGLTDAEKRARVDQFAGQVRRTIYTGTP